MSDSSRQTRSKTPAGTSFVKLSLNGREGTVEPGDTLKGANAKPNLNVDAATTTNPARSRGPSVPPKHAPSRPPSSSRAKSVPPVASNTSRKHNKARPTSDTSAPPNGSGGSSLPQTGDKPTYEPPSPTAHASPKRLPVTLEEVEDEDVRSHRGESLPPSSTRILEEVRGKETAPGHTGSSSKRQPLFDPTLASSDEESADPTTHGAAAPARAPTPARAPASASAPPAPPAGGDRPLTPDSALHKQLEDLATMPTLDTILVGENAPKNAEDDTLADDVNKKPDLLDIVGEPDDDEEDYDGLEQEPKPVYSKGRIAEEFMERILALVQAFDTGMVEVARDSHKPLSYIWRLAMPHLKLSRAPNLFNMFVKKWCYENKKLPNETFTQLRERFLTAYREEVGTMSKAKKNDLRKELLKWNEDYDKNAAQHVQEAGDLYKIMLQARMEFEVLAQYYYRFYDIATFGWCCSVRPGDAVAMQANSTFASTTAAAKWMDSMGSHIPAAMDQFAAIVKIHKAAEVSMSDWSKETEASVLRTGGEHLKKRVTHFLIKLQNAATRRNRNQAQWQNFPYQLVKARTVIMGWPEDSPLLDAPKTFLCNMEHLRTFTRLAFATERGEAEPGEAITWRPMDVEKEAKYAESRSTREAWKKIPIWYNNNGDPILTVGDALKEEARRRKEKGQIVIVDSDDEEAFAEEPSADENDDIQPKKIKNRKGTTTKKKPTAKPVKSKLPSAKAKKTAYNGDDDNIDGEQPAKTKQSKSKQQSSKSKKEADTRHEDGDERPKKKSKTDRSAHVDEGDRERKRDAERLRKQGERERKRLDAQRAGSTRTPAIVTTRPGPKPGYEEDFASDDDSPPLAIPQKRKSNELASRDEVEPTRGRSRERGSGKRRDSSSSSSASSTSTSSSGSSSSSARRARSPPSRRTRSTSRGASQFGGGLRAAASLFDKPQGVQTTRKTLSPFHFDFGASSSSSLAGALDIDLTSRAGLRKPSGVGVDDKTPEQQQSARSGLGADETVAVVVAQDVQRHHHDGLQSESEPFDPGYLITAAPDYAPNNAAPNAVQNAPPVRMFDAQANGFGDNMNTHAYEGIQAASIPLPVVAQPPYLQPYGNDQLQQVDPALSAVTASSQTMAPIAHPSFQPSATAVVPQQQQQYLQQPYTQQSAPILHYATTEQYAQQQYAQQQYAQQQQYTQQQQYAQQHQFAPTQQYAPSSQLVQQQQFAPMQQLAPPPPQFVPMQFAQGAVGQQEQQFTATQLAPPQLIAQQQLAPSTQQDQSWPGTNMSASNWSYQ
ncbi:hypothetical protein EXIGLDRAFT_769494 [Exidia glandulosa HHB12029]|uniref:Uncharacterized protein n=1 Tax=Exidia glandulosa HHB12029 TaxID=1314781 RepID=A0A165HFV7_EXIGL|nr:hypothetical protein EXIGLDRAFT_769494 [Exidia glandulosa HHB12029]